MTNKQKVFSLSFLTVIIWASAFPITKIVQEQFSSYSLGFLRCAIAAILLLLIGKVSHMRRPVKKDMPLFMLSGLLGFTLYMILFNTGILTLTSATSSIIIALTPIMVAIGASKYYGESIKPVGWFCILSAFLGVLILLLWEGVFSINAGLIWTIAAAVVFCGYNLMSRMFAQRGYTSLEVVTYSMLFGAIFLGFWAAKGFRELANADLQHTLALLYLGILPSALAYLFWGRAMALAERTSEVTNFMFVTPLLSTIMGFLILKEIPNIGTFVGGGIIIASIVVFNLKGK